MQNADSAQALLDGQTWERFSVGEVLRRIYVCSSESFRTNRRFYYLAQVF